MVPAGMGSVYVVSPVRGTGTCNVTGLLLLRSHRVVSVFTSFVNVMLHHPHEL